MSGLAIERVTTDPFRRDRLSYGLLAVHLAVMAYVLLGWMSNSRIGLLVYLLFLSALNLQWLFNRGSSLLNNFDTYLRTDHWRDPRNADEGAFLQNLIKWATGLSAGQTQIMIAVYSLMFLLWQAALFRMVMIIPPLPMIPG
jgi:hypothetical protein